MKHTAGILVTVVLLLSRSTDAQERSIERIPTRFVENNRPVELEVVVFKPDGAGPFPTVMFNHGSTGRGDKPSTFRNTFAPGIVARFFNDRGWSVVFPQRRGRGKSDGLYDEGFELDRSQYSCIPRLSLAGLDRALEDLDAVLAYLKTRSDVDRKRVLIGGVSRGGVLSIAHAGRHPDAFVGAINFLGGWMMDACPDPEAINTITFKRSGAFKGPTIWLYGENDPFYSIDHSRKNFDAYVAAGGNGVFSTFLVGPGKSGHLLLSNPALWQEALAAFLESVR